MSSSDIAEAMAFAQMEPFGPERADLRAGIIASVIANVNRSKGSKAFKPKDFMPDFDKDAVKKNLVRQIKEVFAHGNIG